MKTFETCPSESVKRDATLSAGVCQGLTASQTAECCEILTIVWGEAEECRLPGYVHCHQWTQPEASSHEGRPGPTDPTVKHHSPLPSVISYPSLLDSVDLLQLDCLNTEYRIEELLTGHDKNFQRLDIKCPVKWELFDQLSKYSFVLNKHCWSVSEFCIHCNDCH